MSKWLNQCHFGDCLETLRRMPDGIVQTCVTSPPYFGLRSYLDDGHDDKAMEIGTEPTPDEFIAKLVSVFREVRRVLKPDGTLWLNCGDSFGKGKQLLGIPWRLAFALQADGWILRQDIIWHKPNPMPESVTDRCTKSHEYIFLLAKSEKYYFDAGAIKEQSVTNDTRRPYGSKGAWDMDGRPEEQRPNGKQRSARDSFKRDDSKRAEVMPGQTVGTHRPDRDESEWDTGTRNKRSVWTVATQSYSGAHFAVFPPALIEPCILAGAPAGGVVLDPFGGSGTTAQVAQALGRQWILCELNEAYSPLIEARVCQPSLDFAEAA